MELQNTETKISLESVAVIFKLGTKKINHRKRDKMAPVVLLPSVDNYAKIPTIEGLLVEFEFESKLQ